jgi:hypothetical protein
VAVEISTGEDGRHAGSDDGLHHVDVVAQMWDLRRIAESDDPVGIFYLDE